MRPSVSHPANLRVIKRPQHEENNTMKRHKPHVQIAGCPLATTWRWTVRLRPARHSLYCSQLCHQLSLPVVINYVTTSLLAATPTKDWITASNSFSAAASARKRALLPQKVGSGYKDARKSFPSSAPSCCALKAFLPRTEILHQNSASYCRVRSFTRYFTSLGDSTEKLYCTHSSPATSQRPFLMPSSHGNNGMAHFDVAAAAPASHVDDSESGTSPPGLAADEGCHAFSDLRCKSEL